MREPTTSQAAPRLRHVGWRKTCHFCTAFHRFWRSMPLIPRTARIAVLAAVENAADSDRTLSRSRNRASAIGSKADPMDSARTVMRWHSCSKACIAQGTGKGLVRIQ